MSQQPQGALEVDAWMDAAGLDEPIKVGTLRRSAERRGDTVHFEYSDPWLKSVKDGFETFQLDPQLPLHPGAVYARAGADQLTGAFQDASPDRWGRLLMDRREVLQAREERRPKRNLRPWDYLMGVHDDSRMGALRLRTPEGFYLDSSELACPPVTELRELEAIAIRIDRDDVQDTDENRKWVRRLIVGGGTMGGARPKASVRDAGGRLLMAKFPSSDDRHDVGLWELITCRLAAAAGINMPPATAQRFSNLGSTFLVSRFDRSPTGRRAYASAFTLLDVDDSENSSYLDLVELIEHHAPACRIGEELRQLFARVAFNILIGNRDDHLRNHGFLRAEGGWRMSPAFDVNPNPNRDSHVLSIDEDDPTPDTRLLLDSSAYYRLSKQDAAAIMEQVRAGVRSWKAEAKRVGASGHDMGIMESVIDPDR